MSPPPTPLLLTAALTLLGAHLSARASRCGERASALAAAPRASVRLEGLEGFEGLADGATGPPQAPPLTLNQWAAREGYTFTLSSCPLMWGEPEVWLSRAGGPQRRASLITPSAPQRPQRPPEPGAAP